MELSQHCHAPGNTTSFEAATLAPNQVLEVASHATVDWNVDWTPIHGAELYAICALQGHINCRTQGTIRASYWNKHYNVKVGWDTFIACEE